jgi:hypothetical protein
VDGPGGGSVLLELTAELFLDLLSSISGHCNYRPILAQHYPTTAERAGTTRLFGINPVGPDVDRHTLSIEPAMTPLLDSGYLSIKGDSAATQSFGKDSNRIVAFGGLAAAAAATAQSQPCNEREQEPACL